MGPELITSAAKRSGYFAPRCSAPDPGGILPVQEHARGIDAVLLADEIDDVHHVLLGSLVLLRRPPVSRHRGVRPRDAIRAAVVRLTQRSISHRRDDEIAALLRLGDQAVGLAIRIVHAGAGTQRHEQREFRAGLPARRYEQAVGNRLAGSGKVVDTILLAGVLIQRRTRDSVAAEPARRSAHGLGRSAARSTQ